MVICRSGLRYVGCSPAGSHVVQTLSTNHSRYHDASYGADLPTRGQQIKYGTALQHCCVLQYCCVSIAILLCFHCNIAVFPLQYCSVSIAKLLCLHCNIAGFKNVTGQCLYRSIYSTFPIFWNCVIQYIHTRCQCFYVIRGPARCQVTQFFHIRMRKVSF